MPQKQVSVVLAWALGPLLVAAAAAQEPKPAAASASKLPDFPRVNLAPSYEVDAAWPQKPAAYEWGAVPGVAVDTHDNVWVFTRAKPPVQVYSREGKLLRAWGDDSIGNAHHLKIDRDGNVWVADIGLHVVRKFSPAGNILATYGTPGEPGADDRRLNMPTDMAITPAGEIFVSDGYGNNRVVHFDSQGRFVKAWGRMGTGPRDFSLPHAITIDSQGRLYVADRNNVRVQVYSQAGDLLDSWSNVLVPWGFWTSATDDIWVCGSSPMPWREDPKYPGAPLGCPPKDQLVVRFTTAGRVTQQWTIPKAEDGAEAPGNVNWIHCLAIDSHGDLYVGDIIGKRIQKFILRR